MNPRPIDCPITESPWEHIDLAFSRRPAIDLAVGRPDPALRLQETREERVAAELRLISTQAAEGRRAGEAMVAAARADEAIMDQFRAQTGRAPAPVKTPTPVPVPSGDAAVDLARAFRTQIGGVR